MNTFRYDMHVHTSETSPCGKVKASILANMYKKSGYQGIVITDHYTRQYFGPFAWIGWERRIDRFLRGFKFAEDEGRKIGLSVIMGMEIRFNENHNDYLVYGIDEAFLKENRELYKLGLSGFRSLIKDREILIYQAHPFRRMITPADPLLLDGVEVFNGNARHDSKNHMALSFAKGYNLKMISGSDFHRMEDLGRGGIATCEPINTSQELVRMLKEGKVSQLLGM
jgi:hypothetical protein